MSRRRFESTHAECCWMTGDPLDGHYRGTYRPGNPFPDSSPLWSHLRHVPFHLHASGRVDLQIFWNQGYLSPILLNYTSSIAAPTKVSWSATVHHTTTATESRNNNKNWNPGTSCGHPDCNYYCIILWESNLPSTHFETSTAAESAAPSAATIVVHFRAQYPIFRLQ